MDKFYNPNKDIQIAIQNEMKELKLKKISDNISQSSIDNISLGRYSRCLNAEKSQYDSETLTFNAICGKGNFTVF